MAEWAGPFATYESEVRPEWLDYNDHMHDASYAVVLSEANEELFAWLGLSADYRAETGASLYTVETYIRFVAECSLGQVVRASTVLVSADAKKMRLYTELSVDGVGVVATGESLYVHVDPAIGASTPMPVDRQARVQELLAAHALFPRPAHLGRGVGGRPAAEGQPGGAKNSSAIPSGSRNETPEP